MCIHTQTRLHICICVYVYVYVCINVYVCMCIYIYIYIYIYRYRYKRYRVHTNLEGTVGAGDKRSMEVGEAIYRWGYVVSKRNMLVYLRVLLYYIILVGNSFKKFLNPRVKQLCCIFDITIFYIYIYIRKSYICSEHPTMCILLFIK